MSCFCWKNDQKCQFFTFFGVTRQNFLGSRWNISTNESVLERLLNFWIFGTYFKLTAHLVKIREPPKFKNSKIRVTRKPDLETQNWIYNFSSFIEPYQTRNQTRNFYTIIWHLFTFSFAHWKIFPVTSGFSGAVLRKNESPFLIF